MRQKIDTHGPENAEQELKKTYDAVIEMGVVHFRSETSSLLGQFPAQAVSMYRQAFDAYCAGERLIAERWARAAKHLTHALWHEAKIQYLEPRVGELPFLQGARTEYHFNEDEQEGLTRDLASYVGTILPPEETLASEAQSITPFFLERARLHLEALESPDYTDELLRAERTKAAHEYSRLIECLALALEAEVASAQKKTA